MATSIESLFGITPEDLMASREAQAQKEALTFAQLSPVQRANMGGFMAGRQIGGSIGGLLGAQDPELERIRQRQALVQGIDLADPSALRAAAARALQSGDTSAASLLATRAAEVQKAMLEADKLRAETASKLSERLTPEQKNAQALADTKFERGTPEWTRTYNAELTRLTTSGNQAQWEVKEVGVAEGTREPVYTLREPGKQPMQVVYRRDPATGEQRAVPYNGSVDRTTAKTSVSVETKGEEEFSKALAKLDAGRVGDAVTARDNSITALRSLERLAQLDDAGLISGTFATGRTGATNLLNTLGLTSPADTARLANSENYAKVAGDVILATLGGKLGAGFSNEDRKFIQSLVPQLENSPSARRQLINFMARKNQEIITEATNLENYARKERTLKGYTPKIPLTPSASSTRSAEELARIAGGKIVNGVFVKDAK
jgi:polyhydroxyalkanoate synthesis regulator phasin